MREFSQITLKFMENENLIEEEAKDTEENENPLEILKNRSALGKLLKVTVLEQWRYQVPGMVFLPIHSI